MTDLQELIGRKRAGRSLQKLADASGLTKQTWQPHVTPRDDGPRRLPEPETMIGMARALDVDPETIILAVGVSIGVIPRDRTRPALLDALPPWEVLGRLTDEDIDNVVRFVNLLAGLRTDAVPAQARAERTRNVPGGGRRHADAASGRRRTGTSVDARADTQPVGA